MTVQTGDVLLTRNAGEEEDNPSPGYYNHAAIVSINDWIVEAQVVPNQVIAVPIWYFFDRYPEILILKQKDQSIAHKIGEKALSLVGRKYGVFISLRPSWLSINRDNCVSVVRRSFYLVTRRDYKWRIPDNIRRNTFLFEEIMGKKDYENYVEPEDLYKGMVLEPPDGPPKTEID